MGLGSRSRIADCRAVNGGSAVPLVIGATLEQESDMMKRYARSYRRRGVTVVSTAIVGFPVLLVASALAIDFGKIFGSQGDLQRAADAAALAAVGAMSELTSDNGQLAAARSAAQQYVESNTVFGESLTIDPQVDVVFGSSERNPSTGVYSFSPTENSPNAARVTIRYTANSPNGSAPLLFAKAFGVSSTNITGQATAMFTDASNGDSSSDSSDDSMDGSSSGSSDSSDPSDSASAGSNDSDSGSNDASSGDSNGPDGSSGLGEDSSDSSESSGSCDSSGNCPSGDSGGNGGGDESSIDSQDSADGPKRIYLIE